MTDKRGTRLPEDCKPKRGRKFADGELKRLVMDTLHPGMTLKECAAIIGASVGSVRAQAHMRGLTFKHERPPCKNRRRAPRPLWKYRTKSFSAESFQ